MTTTITRTVTTTYDRKDGAPISTSVGQFEIYEVLANGNKSRSLVWVEIGGEFAGICEASDFYNEFPQFDRRSESR